MSIKVIYIMGHSRSGSTLLDMVLSNAPSVFGAGELCNLIEAMDVWHGYCACGIVSPQCPLWSKVRQLWGSNAGRVGEDYAGLQARFERLRHYPVRLRRYRRDPLMERYAARTRALFDAIAYASGSNVVVDSSKLPVRALALMQVSGLDVRVIHLVRDVRGVANSLLKSWAADPAAGIAAAQSGQSMTRVAMEWMVINAVANRVRARLREHAMLVRYEDLVADPVQTLRRISACSGVDFSAVGAKLEQGMPLRAEHAIEGNRLRLQKQVVLELDVRWHTELSKSAQHGLALLTAPVGMGYGYRPW